MLAISRRRSAVLLLAPFVLVAVMFSRQFMIVGSGDDDVRETNPPLEPLPRRTAAPGAVTSDLATLAEYALSSCRADEHNTPGHKSCILLRNAIITNDVIFYEQELKLNGDRSELGDQFPAPPPSKHLRSRFQLKPYRLERISSGTKSAPPPSRTTTFGLLQSPVSGAQWLNVWHSIGDFFSTLFDTARPFFEMGGPSVDLEWITRPALQHVGKGCATGADCRRLSLFDPFQKLFRGRVTFMESAMEPLKVEFLLVGINTRCCPIPMTGVGSEYCEQNLRAVRDSILKFYDLPTDVRLTENDRQCPHVHFMSRQGDVYRHMSPFDQVVRDLEQSFGVDCDHRKHLHVIKLSGSLPFAEQVRSVANSSVLVAGRGGGTTLSIFLPSGGVYLSVSGFDRWSPFRDLVPSWIKLVHVEAKLVHHQDTSRPPQQFRAGGKSYVDPNRAAYLIAPTNLLSIALWKALREPG